MELDHLFSRQHHRACKWLGNKDWLNLTVGENGIEYKIESNPYQSEQERQKFDQSDFDNARLLLDTYAASNAACCFFLNMFCRMLADGPKLYLPTLDHCLAMENTEVNVPFADYRQPYPVTLIELPTEYTEHIKKEYNTNHPPKYVMCQRHDCGVISAAAWFNPNNTIVNTLAPLDAYKTVEDAIVANSDVILPTYGDVRQALDKDFGVADLVQRLALNFSFFMTIHGLRVTGPLHPHRHEEMTKIVNNKKANPGKRERAKNYFVAPIYVVEFEQKLKFFEVEEEAPDAARENLIEGRTHRSPKPHWRRGHYRRQRSGPGLARVDYKYINPIMVMKRLFVGDVADTSATYAATKKPGAPAIGQVLDLPRKQRG